MVNSLEERYKEVDNEYKKTDDAITEINSQVKARRGLYRKKKKLQAEKEELQKYIDAIKENEKLKAKIQQLIKEKNEVIETNDTFVRWLKSRTMSYKNGDTVNLYELFISEMKKKSGTES